MSRFLLLFIIVGYGLLISCKNNLPESFDEGKINFAINYPVKNYASYMEKIIPKKMTMSFKNNVYKNG